MVEAVMLWNEPNNLSHWNFEIDPGWTTYAQMVNLAADAIRAENSRVRRVLGGISPIDPEFVRTMQRQCAQISRSLRNPISARYSVGLRLRIFSTAETSPQIWLRWMVATVSSLS